MPLGGRSLVVAAPTPGPDRLAHLFLRLSVGERAVERRRVRHLELTQTAADALLGMLARGLDVDDAVVADHREREGTREARVLDPIEQKRGLIAIEHAPLHDHPAVSEHVPPAAPRDPADDQPEEE